MATTTGREFVNWTVNDVSIQEVTHNDITRTLDETTVTVGNDWAVANMSGTIMFDNTNTGIWTNHNHTHTINTGFVQFGDRLSTSRKQFQGTLAISKHELLDLLGLNRSDIDIEGVLLDRFETVEGVVSEVVHIQLGSNSASHPMGDRKHIVLHDQTPEPLIHNMNHNHMIIHTSPSRPQDVIIRDNTEDTPL